ncbi:zinc knuckle CX2CX4HX4C containing protein [Tanacetum coccineum]
MIRNSPVILKKWTMNISLFKEELTSIPVWVKIHEVPLRVFSEDDISLIATQIGKSIMLDSFISLMCIESLGRSIFAHCLIEVKVDAVLKDNITMGIPLPDGSGFSKETARVEYEYKPPRSYQTKGKFESKAHGNSPKNGAPNVTTSVHTSYTKQPAKAVDIPSSSYNRATAEKGGLKTPISSSNIHTSNPYDLLV